MLFLTKETQNAVVLPPTMTSMQQYYAISIFGSTAFRNISLSYLFCMAQLLKQAQVTPGAKICSFQPISFATLPILPDMAE